ncbi:MAG: hypothetical protein AAF236_13810 [Verrucomicrobiota bacterium]
MFARSALNSPTPIAVFCVLLLVICSEQALSQDQTRKREKRPGLPNTPLLAAFNRPDFQEDFPAMCLNAEGKPIVAFVEHDGTADRLKLAELKENGQLRAVAQISAEGVTNITQPCLTRLPNGRHLCVWSQLEADGQWDLVAREIGRKGKAALGAPFHLTHGGGNDIFPDLGTDRHGKVWVVWQSIAEKRCRIFTRHATHEPDSNDPLVWSDRIAVTADDDSVRGGDWEPRLAFGKEDEALIVFDSYRGGNFDLFLTRVSPDGIASQAQAIAQSDRYEARGEAATSPEATSSSSSRSSQASPPTSVVLRKSWQRSRPIATPSS